MRALSVAFSLAILVAVAAQSAEAGRVFDVHLHAVSSSESMLREPPPNPVTHEPTPVRTEEQLRDALYAEMRKHHVVGAVLMNDDPIALRRWLGTNEPRFLAGIGFDSPRTLSLETIKQEHAAGRIRVLAEIGLAYAGLRPDDAALDPFFDLAEKLDIPVGIHMGTTGGLAAYHCCPKYRMELNDPLLLEEVLLKHPRLRIYVMHAGWPFGEHMIALLAAHPQVYVDLGVICWVRPRAEFHAYLEKLMTSGYGQRIMFGSDAMIWPEAIGAGIEAVTSATLLTDAQKADILYNNAARFFRLNE